MSVELRVHISRVKDAYLLSLRCMFVELRVQKPWYPSPIDGRCTKLRLFVPNCGYLHQIAAVCGYLHQFAHTLKGPTSLDLGAEGVAGGYVHNAELLDYELTLRALARCWSSRDDYLKCVAVCCSVLQCVAVRYRMSNSHGVPLSDAGAQVIIT